MWMWSRTDYALSDAGEAGTALRIAPAANAIYVGRHVSVIGLVPVAVASGPEGADAGTEKSPCEGGRPKQESKSPAVRTC